jgi:hypothetical protein
LLTRGGAGGGTGSGSLLFLEIFFCNIDGPASAGRGVGGLPFEGCLGHLRDFSLFHSLSKFLFRLSGCQLLVVKLLIAKFLAVKLLVVNLSVVKLLTVKIICCFALLVNQASKLCFLSIFKKAENSLGALALINDTVNTTGPLGMV